MADEHKSPVEQALDLMLYAPLGLALTAKDELPQLIAKGKERLGTQIMMARMIGKFAVAQGQKEAEKVAGQVVEQVGVVAERLGGMGGPGGLGGPGGTGAASGQTPAARRAAASAGEAVAATARATEHFPVPADDLGHGSNGSARNGAAVSASVATGPDVDSLAIPGYDSLSASQVVQRLAGLSPDELDAVRRYEDGHRGRRTILSKVAQLQSNPS